MRKLLTKLIGFGLCCMLLSVSAAAIGADAPLVSGRLAETVPIDEVIVIDGAGNVIDDEITWEESDSNNVTFTTDFILTILPEVKAFEEGVVTLGTGAPILGGPGGLGTYVAERGMDFDPPLIAALICGGGYLICAGIANYAGNGKRTGTGTREEREEREESA